MEWQPIETIPHGEAVLVHRPGMRDGVDVASFYPAEDGMEEHWWTSGGPNAGSDYTLSPEEKYTHWMPLPELPVTEAKHGVKYDN